MIRALNRSVGESRRNQGETVIRRNEIQGYRRLSRHELEDVFGDALGESWRCWVCIVTIVERDDRSILTGIEHGHRAVAAGATAMAVRAGLSIEEPCQRYLVVTGSSYFRAHLMIQSDCSR